jgi:hypothetical protein
MQQVEPADGAVPKGSRWLLAAIAFIVWLVFDVAPPGLRDLVLVFLFLALVIAGIVFLVVGRRTAPNGPSDSIGPLMNKGEDNARASLGSSAPIEPR